MWNFVEVAVLMIGIAKGALASVGAAENRYLDPAVFILRTRRARACAPYTANQLGA